MEKCKILLLKTIIFLMFFFCFSANAQRPFLDDFPEACSYATDQEPMPGHVLRLGMVNLTKYGWSFFFPDQRLGRNLQMVEIANNAGLIGQGPNQNFDWLVRTPTPRGYFVAAQIFIGNPDLEPLVTCLSRLIPVGDYRSSYYGERFEWLDRDTFIRWLKWRRYSKWKWREAWRSDFYQIRRHFYQHRYDKDWRWRWKRHRDDDSRRWRWKRDSDDDDRRRRMLQRRIIKRDRDDDDDRRRRMLQRRIIKRDRDDDDDRRRRMLQRRIIKRDRDDDDRRRRMLQRRIIKRDRDDDDRRRRKLQRRITRRDLDDDEERGKRDSR